MKLLFVVEAVTLAHVGRSLALANALHARGVALEFALAGSTGQWAMPFPQHALPGIGAKAFAEALRTGNPVLDFEVLRRSAEADRQLLEALRPSLVIGDFRLSLSVSARKAGVPYATLSNAYWGEPCRLPMPLPVLPLSRWLPLPIARALFQLGSPFVVPRHAAPMNRLRQENGLPSLGSELRRVYTDADHVLYADIPDMFDSDPLPPNHHFLGPVLWSPSVAPPPWWESWDEGGRSAYVSMGSSGDPRALRRLVEVLLAMDLRVMAATAGSPVLDDLEHGNLRHAPYLPGDLAARRVSFVVCNGGSMGCQQALVADRPVLGICGNMDQFFNMAGVEALGAGVALRADRLDATTLRKAVARLSDDTAIHAAAARAGERMRAHDAGSRLHALLPTLAGASNGAGSGHATRASLAS